MDKSVFLKPYAFSRELQRSMMHYHGESQEDYENRVRIAHYGIEGEDRFFHELDNVFLPVFCLADIRIELLEGNAQADFIILYGKRMFIVEVKNLYGHIHVTEEERFIRVIPRLNSLPEEEGMKNPFVQLQRQKNLFNRFLSYHHIKCDIDVLVVMANPRTKIKLEKETAVIRYDEIHRYLEALSLQPTEEELEFAKSVGDLLIKHHKDRKHFFTKQIKKDTMKVPLPSDLSDEQFSMYEKILEERRRIANEKKLPICNIFTNKDALALLKNFPLTKEEFIQTPGFKEKKYQLFGENLLELFRHHKK